MTTPISCQQTLQHPIELLLQEQEKIKTLLQTFEPALQDLIILHEGGDTVVFFDFDEPGLRLLQIARKFSKVQETVCVSFVTRYRFSFRFTAKEFNKLLDTIHHSVNQEDPKKLDPALAVNALSNLSQVSTPPPIRAALQTNHNDTFQSLAQRKLLEAITDAYARHMQATTASCTLL